MIIDKISLRNCLAYERNIYSQYMFPSKLRYLISRIKREPIRMIYSFLVLSRKTDYYLHRYKHENIIHKICYLYYISLRNRLGEKLGFEISTENIGKGLLIYHFNIVINSEAIIGENCHLHGNNCIGNNGINNQCPILGDNVSLGVGAKVIGDVFIASNIKIAAGAVVVHSFKEEGIVIGGIPAKKIK